MLLSLGLFFSLSFLSLFFLTSFLYLCFCWFGRVRTHFHVVLTILHRKLAMRAVGTD